MDRRSFLSVSAAGAALASLSFRTPQPGERRLPEALARAQAAGKPLFAVVVPDDVPARARSGRILGTFLRKADDAALAPLALCELCCVSRAELIAHLGESAVPADAFGVLIETNGSTPASSVCSLEGLEDPLRFGERFARLLHPTADSIELRMKQTLGAHGPRTSAGIDFHDPQARPRTADVDRAASLVLNRAQVLPAERQLWLERLANAAAARLWDRDPDGARWTVDPAPSLRPDPCPPCGMARIPEPARTFLDFYTR